MMGKHDQHLPKKDLNKTVGHGAQPADPQTLGRLARGQGIVTKGSAKEAKKGKK